MAEKPLCMTLKMKIFNQQLKNKTKKTIRNCSHNFQLSAWKRLSESWENIQIIQRMEESIQICVIPMHLGPLRPLYEKISRILEDCVHVTIIETSLLGTYSVPGAILNAKNTR